MSRCRRATFLGLIMATTTMFTAGTAAPPKDLDPFSFLIGEWTASGGGKPGAATGATVFTRELQDTVIVRKNHADYPATEKAPASRHDDLMVVYAAAGTVKADYYDSEGHVIHYTVISSSPGAATFLSEAGGGPRFRLTYTQKAGGVLAGEFATAPPGSPEAFTPYLTWESHRAGTGASPAKP